MIASIDIKLITSVLAVVLLIIGYLPYFRDIFLKKTKPHLYTWLIWVITQGTAAAALLYGGGKFGSILLIAGTILVFIIFLLSFKYGTKNITNSDKVILALALFAIFIWWQLDNALIAVIMVSAIDAVACVPTIRKSYKNPWSETISFWLIMVFVVLLAIISLAEYNSLTVTYLAAIFVMDLIVLVICLFRRRVIPNKNPVADK